MRAGASACVRRPVSPASWPVWSSPPAASSSPPRPPPPRPPPPTSVQDCEKYIAQHSSKKGTAGIGQACYEGSIGNQTSCAASLTAVGISANVASGACRAAH
ncbi:hypothetical protein ACFQFR_19115 [Streptomyces goshikiensis]